MELILNVCLRLGRVGWILLLTPILLVLSQVRTVSKIAPFSAAANAVYLLVIVLVLGHGGQRYCVDFFVSVVFTSMVGWTELTYMLCCTLFGYEQLLRESGRCGIRLWVGAADRIRHRHLRHGRHWTGKLVA